MAGEILLRMNEDVTWGPYDPYATIDCDTKEDYERLVELVERGKKAKWIPVTERLPGTGEIVLAYIAHNYTEDGWRAYRVYEYTDHWIGMGNLCRVIAWMPVPEPPKED